jgi:hypothetical protein
MAHVLLCHCASVQAVPSAWPMPAFCFPLVLDSSRPPLLWLDFLPLLPFLHCGACCRSVGTAVLRTAASMNSAHSPTVSILSNKVSLARARICARRPCCPFNPRPAKCIAIFTYSPTVVATSPLIPWWC